MQIIQGISVISVRPDSVVIQCTGVETREQGLAVIGELKLLIELLFNLKVPN